jgi:hypothetical protein
VSSTAATACTLPALQFMCAATPQAGNYSCVARAVSLNPPLTRTTRKRTHLRHTHTHTLL